LTLTARTDAHGGFKFSKVGSRTFQVCVEARGFKSRCLAALNVRSGKQELLGPVALEISGCCGGVGIDARPQPINNN
jgi:hypothetical protein